MIILIKNYKNIVNINKLYKIYIKMRYKKLINFHSMKKHGFISKNKLKTNINHFIKILDKK